ncbi:temperature sensitive supressor-like protein [Achlya hypogyna]|uniref:Temperature sensitive supressor-like protein n=1 Tax=Achlya hypogyna TaxID=1202772 RepID=A0A1V9Z8F2_ACHHY|nr:temperature sensitive supressor-like protein [Achlya hypogyna]
MSLWDSPLVNSVAFHPRRHTQGVGLPPQAIDGSFTERDVSLGYRFFRPPTPDAYEAVVLLFHGNAEIAADYASAASVLAAMRVPTALIAVDFRGYGWSSGEPAVTRLLEDAEMVERQLSYVAALKPGVPVILFGRSIGSICAMHLAAARPDRFRGLIVESGFHSILQLPMVQQMAMFMPGGAGMLSMLPEIFNIRDKLASVRIPFLVIHGQEDEIAPLQQGRDLYEACASSSKKLQVFPNAGHNDLQLKYHTEYYAAVQWLLDHIASPLTALQNAFAARQYERAMRLGKDALADANADRLAVLSVLAKAAWCLYEVESVIKWTTQLLDVAPHDVNALCLRAKAHLKLQETNRALDDAVALSQVLARDTGADQASVAVALLAITFWTVQ